MRIVMMKTEWLTRATTKEKIIGVNKISLKMDGYMNYSEGLWHSIVGLEPQYEHMKGTPAYEEYMSGYDSETEEDDE